MRILGPDSSSIKEFFESAWKDFGTQVETRQVPLLLVAHMLGSHMAFFDHIERLFDRVLYFPKRKSIDQEVLAKVERKSSWTRSSIGEKDLYASPGVGASLEKELNMVTGEPVVIIDVGGKFADKGAIALLELLQNHPIRVVEGTENGYRKYVSLLERLKNEHPLANLQVWSVARSKLKDPEDSLTGRAIAEATETIVRVNYGLLGDLPATVFGYGKIGKSVALALREKRLHVGVVETHPLVAIQAQCDGFRLRTAEEAQELGGFVFLATGSGKYPEGLHVSLLENMAKETLVTFVTSADDELAGSEKYFTPGNLKPLNEGQPSDYLEPDHHLQVRVREHLVDCLQKFPTDSGVNVVIVNEGSPPNFLFEASCGPYIYLVFFGMLACLANGLRTLDAGNLQLNELSRDEEKMIGGRWLSLFGPKGDASRGDVFSSER